MDSSNISRKRYFEADSNEAQSNRPENGASENLKVEPGPKMANLNQNFEDDDSKTQTVTVASTDSLAGTRSHSVSSNFSSISSSGVASMISAASHGNNATNGSSSTQSSNAPESGGPVENGRTTLFISGLPQDVKARELYLMCRLMPGYERSVLQVKSAKHSPVGFVTFATRQQAVVAKQALNGIRFDPNDSRLLRVEFARKPTIDISNNSVASTASPSGQVLIPGLGGHHGLLNGLLPSPATQIPLQPLGGNVNQGISLLNLSSLFQQNPSALLASSQPGILTLNSMPFQAQPAYTTATGSFVQSAPSAPSGANGPELLFPFAGKQM